MEKKIEIAYKNPQGQKGFYINKEKIEDEIIKILFALSILEESQSKISTTLLLNILKDRDRKKLEKQLEELLKKEWITNSKKINNWRLSLNGWVVLTGHMNSFNQ